MKPTKPKSLTDAELVKKYEAGKINLAKPIKKLLASTVKSSFSQPAKRGK